MLWRIFIENIIDIDKISGLGIIPLNEIERAAAPPQIIIFVVGIVAGYIVDGILIYATGSSGGEWVAKVLAFHRANPSYTTIHVSASGKVHGGTGGSF